MKTLTLIVLALALSYATPRAQMGARTRSRSVGSATIRTTQTQTVPGTYRSSYRTRTTTTRTFPRGYRSYQSNFRDQGLENRDQRIESIRLRDGMPHTYGLHHRRFARMMRER